MNKPQPRLLNYTTSISPEKTVSEIQQKLAQHGAFQILHDGMISGVSFKIRTKFGELAFQLPANIEAVEKIMQSQFRRGKMVGKEQATRVAWRIIKDWTEAQLALLQTGMVTVEQVFMPYMQDAKGRTLYEALVDKKFAGLALEDKR